MARIPANNDIESNVRFLEAMNARYNNHPYFTVRLAVCMEGLGATAINARLLRQVFTYPLFRTPPDGDPRPKNPWEDSGSKIKFSIKVWNDTRKWPRGSLSDNTSNRLRVGC